ncbi:hypothetical protein J2S74_000031 [Evansella vedderi]|uniref:Uncharacterized protein n=1 Tax=Evansella vedderi TaxID=38282 RepID=A0ABT9ZN57_9BACI|nr:DUF6241 domain-containing protein [Evansella vedderi]MDQ0252659.1 hypothetical protein [Evansella vedderi]
MEEIEIEPEVVEEIQESYIDSLERDIPMDLSEAGVQNLIHWMSHQKIAADTKWGHFEITQERVERLLEVVKINDYEHQDIYLDILQRWGGGDFSQAVEDHNRIWTLQGGTVGKATRLLTPEEEQAYINYHFRRDAVTEEEENGEP